MSLKQELEKKSFSHVKLIWIISGMLVIASGYGLSKYFSAKSAATIVAVPTEYTIKKGNITL